MEQIKSLFLKIFGKLDPVLFFCSTSLSIISVLTVWGSVGNFGASKLRMQVFISIVGVVITILLSHVDFRILTEKRNVCLLLLGASVVLLLLPFTPLGSSGVSLDTGNKSWLVIPFTGLMVQPSEFTKLSFICTFAAHLFYVRKRINRPLTLLLLAVHALLIIGPILLSGDLGVALVYGMMVLILLFCAGVHLLYFVGGSLVALLLSPFLWTMLKGYQQRRIIAGFNPEAYVNDAVLRDYVRQPLRSRTTIAAGGLFGQGIFGGEHYEILAASHTDFIYATVCEKFGFIGGALVLILYIVMVVRIFMIAHTANRSDCGGLICAGVGGMLIIQIVLNVGMCFAMLPVIGITLPFLSCGGSSMLALFMMFGLVHSVYSHSNAVRDFEKTDTFDIDSSLLDS